MNLTKYNIYIINYLILMFKNLFKFLIFNHQLFKIYFFYINKIKVFILIFFI